MSQKKSFELTWKNRLPKRRASRIEHPTSILELRDWPDLNDVAYYHISYLELCEKHLMGNWLDPWREVFAIGPFLRPKRPYRSIPFVIVANYRRPYRHLLRLGEILSVAYLEFGILPDIHLLPIKTVDILEETDNIQWAKTRKISIPLSKG